MLVGAFPGSNIGATDAAVQAYLIATEDAPLAAIEAGVKRFLKRQVPGQNPNFAPSAPALSAECDMQAKAIAFTARKEAGLITGPTGTLPERSLEERRAMQQRLAALRISVGDEAGDRDVA